MHRFNLYSWILILIYAALVFIMEYFSPKLSLEIIYLSLPLISVFIFWSEKTTVLLQKSDTVIIKEEAFLRDLFLITFGFFSGYLLYLMFEYNNSDARGWWVIAIYFVSAQGVLFAFIFSLLATILNGHKKYTFIFTGILILIQTAESIIAKPEWDYISLLILIGLHFLFCLGSKLINKMKLRY